METAANRKELEQIEDKATQTVLRELKESKPLQSERKQTDKLILHRKISRIKLKREKNVKKTVQTVVLYDVC